MLSITSSASPARSMRAMIASRSSRATTSSATTGTNAVTMRSRSRRADARSCPPSRASASTPRAGCHSSGTSGGCNTTEATGRTIRAARRPAAPTPALRAGLRRRPRSSRPRPVGFGARPGPQRCRLPFLRPRVPAWRRATARSADPSTARGSLGRPWPRRPRHRRRQPGTGCRRHDALSSDPPVLHRLSPPAVGIVPGHDHTSRLLAVITWPCDLRAKMRHQ